MLRNIWTEGLTKLNLGIWGISVLTMSVVLSKKKTSPRSNNLSTFSFVVWLMHSVILRMLVIIPILGPSPIAVNSPWSFSIRSSIRSFSRTTASAPFLVAIARFSTSCTKDEERWDTWILSKSCSLFSSKRLLNLPRICIQLLMINSSRILYT